MFHTQMGRRWRAETGRIQRCLSYFSFLGRDQQLLDGNSNLPRRRIYMSVFIRQHQPSPVSIWWLVIIIAQLHPVCVSLSRSFLFPPSPKRRRSTSSKIYTNIYIRNEYYYIIIIILYVFELMQN